MRRVVLATVAAAAAVLAGCVSAGADSFTPITVSLSLRSVARLHAKFRLTAQISADAGVLDIAEQPIRIGVRLAGECNADYEHTAGPAVLNKHLVPQPSTGHAYSATISGWGRPTAYGVQTLCLYIEDRVGRVYVNDESAQVDVSRPCTAAGNRYDRDNRALRRARRRLRHAHARSARRRWRRTVARDKRRVGRDRRHGVAACGSGVPL